MEEKNVTKRSWLSVPPWIIVGAVAVLLPIIVITTVRDIRSMRQRMTALFLERGAYLIGTFEAGTRTGFMGMLGMPASVFELQRLLTETAQQPGIAYIIVTDVDGNILHHNDPKKIGGVYGTDLDLKRIAQSEEDEYREIPNPSGAPTFEVFRRFLPTLPRDSEDFRRMVEEFFRRSRASRDHNRSRVAPDSDESPMPRNYERPRRLRDFDGSRLAPGYEELVSKRIVFVGLDMDRSLEFWKRQRNDRLIMAFVLLLIGFAGIVSLFLVQAYRSARTSVRRIKAFSDNVVENMPIGLLAVDTDGRIVSFNQTAEGVLQITAQKVLGKDAKEVLPKPLERLSQELGADEDVIEKEIECRLEDGRTIPMEISVSRLAGDDGVSMGHIILFSDLTEIQELKREVERAQRLASLGRLAAGIAHEIRNPLSSIKGFATYFGERYRDIPEDRKTAEIMVEEVERLNRVIGQLLEFARPLAVKKKSASMETTIHHSLKMIERDAQAKHIRVETDLSHYVPEVHMDPDRMNQVFLNLYLNAIEAMEDGGTLSVALNQREDLKSVRIIVSDTGSGIKKADLVHVFDPYFTTKQSGTGLGLAIVHRIIEAHKGEIRVESETGRGTSVTIILPVDA
ncbi:MAG: PAS domain S-box protein [Deltaproteobacteria bacterium]|nr:PAS domain S-box protein [Deltaproteobacteria bacterium]